MSSLQRCYRFQMKPNREQEQSLLRLAGARRFVWNWSLARRKAYFAEHGSAIPAAQLSSELTALKDQPGTAWLRDADSQALQQTLRDLDMAFRAFFEKRARFPRFKSKKRDTPRFRIPQRVKIVEGKVYVPKIGWVRIRQSQPIEGQTKSATFKRDACGRWYVALVAVFDVPAMPETMPKEVVGIDLGLIDFATFSTGEAVRAPKFFRKGQRRLRRAQRTFCRRKPGSNRKAKAKVKIARVHQRIANQRNDFLHKLSTETITQFDGVCIEDLNLKGLVRTKLAKSFVDAALGEFVRQLRYKAIWYGKRLIVIDRYFPSSKRCHACGAINDALTLADRQWFCACGLVHDRDHNASLNIRNEGMRLFAEGHSEKPNARGVLVSLPPGA